MNAGLITDHAGRLLGLRCHDGHLIAVSVSEPHSARLDFRRLDGSLAMLSLSGIRYLAVDGFLQGNIVDTAYLWPVLEAPRYQRLDAAKAFSIEESSLDRENSLGATSLFVLECSYGATVHALISDLVMSEK